MSALEELVTYAPDGTLVNLDGTPARPLGPWKVCDNTLFAHVQQQKAERATPGTRRQQLHVKAVARRRKAKRGGRR